MTDPGTVDYIWYGRASDASPSASASAAEARPLLRVAGVLGFAPGAVARMLLEARLPGLPTRDFASDHFCVMARLVLSPPEQRHGAPDAAESS